MKLRMNITKASITLAVVALVGVAATSCTKGGGGITDNGSAPGGAGGSGALTVSAVYPSSSGSNWTPITLGGRYYIAGSNLSISGGCARGINRIRVNEGANPDYAEEATCSASGTFTWSRAFAPGQSDFTLTITAYDVDDLAISGATASVDVRLDSIAPGAVVVTDPATSSYQYLGASSTYLITGTCDADTYRIQTDGGIDITPVGTNWSYTVNITEGASLDFHFYARDLAGNVASVVTQTIIHTPDIVTHFASVGAGEVVTGTSSFGLEATLGWDPGALVSTTPAGGSAYGLDTGFNYVTNQARGLVYVGY